VSFFFKTTHRLTLYDKHQQRERCLSLPPLWQQSSPLSQLPITVCGMKEWRRLFAFERQLGITWISGIKGLTTSII
jgi:hypothetical protein